MEAEQVLQQWQLPQYAGYPADTEDLGDLLQSLQDAKIVEVKTRRVKNHGRLGLSALNEEGSLAQLIRLKGKDKALELLVGNSAADGSGHYVRFVDDPQTYLIDKVLGLPEQKQDWLATDVFALDFEQVRRLEISGSEQEVFSIERQELPEEASTNEEASLPLVEDKVPKLAEHFQLLSVALRQELGQEQGQELQYPSILDGLVRNVLGLSVEDVMLKEGAQGLSQTHEFNLEYKEQDNAMSLAFSLLSDNQETPSYWLSRESSPWLLKLSEFDYKQITKPKSEYLQEVASEQE